MYRAAAGTAAAEHPREEEAVVESFGVLKIAAGTAVVERPREETAFVGSNDVLQ